MLKFGGGGGGQMQIQGGQLYIKCRESQFVREREAPPSPPPLPKNPTKYELALSTQNSDKQTKRALVHDITCKKVLLILDTSMMEIGRFEVHIPFLGMKLSL